MSLISLPRNAEKSKLEKKIHEIEQDILKLEDLKAQSALKYFMNEFIDLSVDAVKITILHKNTKNNWDISLMPKLNLKHSSTPSVKFK